MNISLLAIINEKGVLGQDNKIPWYIPEDRKLFKELTLNKTVVMGRRTWETIGKPLKNRENIILSRNKNYSAEGSRIVHSLEKLLEIIPSKTEVINIGGAEIYKLLLPYTNKMYITKVYDEIEGDTYFPEVIWDVWEEIQKRSLSTNSVKAEFYVYQRKL